VLLAAVMAGLGTGVLPGGRAPSARADETTASQDLLRTGWDQNEPGLSPGTVGGTGFGQLFSTAVNGQVYGQPLVVGQSVIVGTTQVTYNGWPLYEYSGDHAPGDTNGTSGHWQVIRTTS
jgi:hypothetical protein